MTEKDRNQVKILGIGISSTSLKQVLNFVESRLGKDKFYITTPNPEILVQAQKDHELAQALNHADLSLPDGIGIILAASFLDDVRLNRLRGREVMLKLIEYSNKHCLKVFLLGATDNVIKRTLRTIRKRYKKLQVEGASGPRLNASALPISDRDRLIQIDIIDRINKFKPDLLFVAFGAPKQEKWINSHLKELDIGGAMGVGGSFDYISGEVALPPIWMGDIGLEWLWRLIIQPSRILRIARAVVIFPILVILSRIGLKRD